jgi:hypothetical protein
MLAKIGLGFLCVPGELHSISVLSCGCGGFLRAQRCGKPTRAPPCLKLAQDAAARGRLDRFAR